MPGTETPPPDVGSLVLQSKALRSRLDYRRFAAERSRVLLIEARYHLVSELRRALSALGHEVFGVPVVEDAGQMVRGVLAGLAQHRPDFLLTINHLGFDEGGLLGALLDALEIPVAAWYVDSPLFVLRGRPIPAPSMSIVFTWERTLVPVLARSCEARHLPLATDPDLFTEGSRPTRAAISFVGDSGTSAQEKWSGRLAEDDEPTVKRLERVLLARSPGPFADDSVRTCPRAADRLAAATAKANTDLRIRFLRPFVSESLQIHGDAGWSNLLPEAPLRPGPAYGTQLAEVYGTTDVNLNVTSLQMPTAVNQRVFDVPAAGGFLLTDEQSDLWELFDEDEMATWSSFEEAVDRARFYLRYPERRRELVGRARRRVLAEHTYQHRAASLVEAMTAQFGPARVPAQRKAAATD